MGNRTVHELFGAAVDAAERLSKHPCVPRRDFDDFVRAMDALAEGINSSADAIHRTGDADEDTALAYGAVAEDDRDYPEAKEAFLNGMRAFRAAISASRVSS